MTSLLEFRAASLVREGRTILESVDLRVESGEMIAVVGPNGAGKSTLLEACLGLLPSANAHVFLNGKPLSELGFAERARAIGFSGREELDPHGLTTSEIVRLGTEANGLSPSEQSGSLERLLVELDLVALRDRPLGSLSSGERQRVHFARVLAQSPSLLLLDEAVAHLDLGHRESAAKRTRTFVEAGGSVLAVVHELGYAVRHYDRLVVLGEGRIVADGKPNEVLGEEILERIFAVRAKIATIDGKVQLLVEGQA